MKLLLDENLPHQMRLELTGHEVATVSYMNWSGIENGELLQVAADAGFEALITNDRGLEHQQSRDSLPIAVVLILAEANNIEAIRPLYDELLAALQMLKPREFLKLGST